MKTLLCFALVACASSPTDVVGPYTGSVHRYVVDKIEFPSTIHDAIAIGDDLDGDGAADNAIGQVFVTLAGNHDTSAHAADMIASGAIASTIEIQADDLGDDPTVAVTYIGVDGAPATLAGGTLAAGSFRSNRARETRVPGAARIRFPFFADTDPVTVDLVGLEIDLDSDGNGGFTGFIRGGVLVDQVVTAMTTGISAMLAANPGDHIVLYYLLDTNKDGIVSTDEIANNQLTRSLVWPDIQLFASDGTFAPDPHKPARDSLSFAVAIHITPCDAGSCAPAQPADPCHDRVLDGDETDVDCGGSCGACPGGAGCAIAGDCQTGTCTVDGTCAQPSCTDGIKDGFERDVDCSYTCKCAVGQTCTVDADCASGHCDTEGVCTP